MMLCEYTFAPRGDVRLDDLADEVQRLLGALAANGSDLGLRGGTRGPHWFRLGELARIGEWQPGQKSGGQQ